jgi:hypothetical protein
MRCKFQSNYIPHLNMEKNFGSRCGVYSKFVREIWLGSSCLRQISANSLAELVETAAVCCPRCVGSRAGAAKESPMTYRVQGDELATVAEARRELAAEARKVADLLDSQEPDSLALHDAWEVLVELAERTERLRTRFLKEQPEQEAWLIGERPWLDPKLQLIGKAKKPARGPSSPPRSRASRSRRAQKAAHSSV